MVFIVSYFLWFVICYLLFVICYLRCPLAKSKGYLLFAVPAREVEGLFVIFQGRRKKEERRRKKEEGRRKKEEGRRKKEEGRRKKVLG
ncbi:MAG: hypothetical protein EAZ68_11200, partial [Oscillatoriales cyanobacterium]